MNLMFVLIKVFISFIINSFEIRTLSRDTKCCNNSNNSTFYGKIQFSSQWRNPSKQSDPHSIQKISKVSFSFTKWGDDHGIDRCVIDRFGPQIWGQCRLSSATRSGSNQTLPFQKKREKRNEVKERRDDRWWCRLFSSKITKYWTPDYCQNNNTGWILFKLWKCFLFQRTS